MYGTSSVCGIFTLLSWEIFCGCFNERAMLNTLCERDREAEREREKRERVARERERDGDK